jgi:hypothetical protein
MRGLAFVAVPEAQASVLTLRAPEVLDDAIVQFGMVAFDSEKTVAAFIEDLCRDRSLRPAASIVTSAPVTSMNRRDRLGAGSSAR